MIPNIPENALEHRFSYELLAGTSLEVWLSTSVANGGRAQRIEGSSMRKHLLLFIFSGLLFVLALPSASEAKPDTDAVSQAPVAVQRVAVPSKGLRDEAAMVLIGTTLIGLGAAVRRAA